MASKDFSALFRALTEQGWEKKQTSARHWKVTPPNKNMSIVCFSASDDPRAFPNTIRDLRASGFIWPWPAKTPKKPTVKEKTMPASVTNLRTEPANEPAPKEDVDDLFRQLKDARNYAALAREARDEAKAKLEQAETAFHGSEKEFELAQQQLQRVKAAFDKAFSESR